MMKETYTYTYTYTYVNPNNLVQDTALGVLGVSIVNSYIRCICGNVSDSLWF
jgi:hypothetical protein